MPDEMATYFFFTDECPHVFNRRKNNVVFNFKKGFVFKKYVKTKMAFSRSFQSSINFSKRAECLFL